MGYDCFSHTIKGKCSWRSIRAREALKENKSPCEANPAGENNSLIFTVCVKSVPLYHFKLSNVVLPMAVKEFFETHF